ncbi:cell division inhibitor [Oceanimonas marisflavi]|uniref:cell division inhibitor n=1 Tax=Oceanimonas marisflavi TaxID=2059724 RepID=UPI000D311947|nr:cell division inhibitor [Oceanimonas marisflavi]
MMNLPSIRKQALIPSQQALPRCTTAALGTTPQPGLLARLAALSHGNSGWILVANAPARLCRQRLLAAGINPARVVDAHRLSPAQLQQALASPAIAAVVCWQQQDGTFLPQRQGGARLFVIGPAVPACPLH